VPDAGACPVVSAQPVWDDLLVAVTVLLVDDHAGFRASARSLLELDGFRVIGEAADAASALDLARELVPEVVLLDVGLPDASGFEVAVRLAGSRSRVVLTSSRAQHDLGRRVQQSGALGFVSKDQLSGATLCALLDSAR
jgi:DNA-binding NarL/FixJ family response regulator